MSLTTMVKDFALREGASLVGIGSVDRFVGAPAGHGPLDFIKNARSVISIGVKIPDAVVDRDSYLEDAQYPPEVRAKMLETHFYMKQGYALPSLMLDQVGYRLALLLEGQGYRSLPFASTYANYTLPDLTPGDIEYFGAFSHRHAAVRAGLGEFGYNNLVITREFGPRVRYTSIITSAELDEDPLVTEPICRREACRECLKVCPSRAISPRPDRPDEIFLNPPSFTYARGCNHRPGNWPLGTCLKVCPVGESRARI